MRLLGHCMAREAGGNCMATLYCNIVVKQTTWNFVLLEIVLQYNTLGMLIVEIHLEFCIAI